MNASNDDPQLEQLLDFLRDTRGLDFTGYKRQSLTRRIRKRMDAVNVTEFEHYRDYMEVHPEEQSQLVDTILINVTSFFRDKPAWTYLAEEVIPAIVARKKETDSIRVWSAGCASGEEAYGLAILFARHLGVEEFKERVKIFATDTDEAALVQARTGVYTEKQLGPVEPDVRDEFFEPTVSGFQFRSDCRRSMIFGRNDITRDAPISRIDLLVCRNVLMYFVSETQRQVLNRFHYALRSDGYLFLGKAETIFSHSNLFDPVDAPRRIFSRTPGPTRPLDLLINAQVPDKTEGPDPRRLSELAAAATPVAQFVVGVDGQLVEANVKARALFGVTAGDLGKRFSDLEVSHRPVQIQPHIELAHAQSQPVVLNDVTRTLADGKTQFLEVVIAPLCDPSGQNLGVSLTFADVTELGQVRVDLEKSTEELASANAELRTANEELETANEELQSINEELETTNEELQSANEELETMNEELQSGNEELETMNEELLSQTGQIQEAERFLASILDSLVLGVAVISADLDVVIWNRAAENLFGLRAEEALDRSFLALDIGLPVGEIGPLLHTAIGNDSIAPQEMILDAVDRRGRPITCRVSVQQLNKDQVPRTGAPDATLVVLIDPLPGPADD